MESRYGSYKVAGIDVHKKMLAVVVAEAGDTDLKFECRTFGTRAKELHHLSVWLKERGVQEVAMESTAQYWKPVWMELEGQCRLNLAQAWSNRGPKGRKFDFRDAKRIVRRLLSGELILSYVPEPEQRLWRTLTRSKHQLTRDKVRLHNQIESLLEEMRIKLSSVISDLLGVSGRRILRALADGETDPAKMAAMGDKNLRATEAELEEALEGQPHAVQRKVLGLFLDRVDLVEAHMTKLEIGVAELMKPHQEAVVRAAELPGFGVDSATQAIAEVGPAAAAFPTGAQMASWVGVCPGRQESAGESSSDRSPKGNHNMRRLLNQAAQSAVKKDGSYPQAVFRRLLPRLGYKKAIWAIAHKLCILLWKVLHDGVRYVEHGFQANPRSERRHRQKLVAALRKLGYQVQLTPLATPST